MSKGTGGEDKGRGLDENTYLETSPSVSGQAEHGSNHVSRTQEKRKEPRASCGKGG